MPVPRVGNRVGKGGRVKAGGLVTKEDKALRGPELAEQVGGAVILTLTQFPSNTENLRNEITCRTEDMPSVL